MLGNLSGVGAVTECRGSTVKATSELKASRKLPVSSRTIEAISELELGGRHLNDILTVKHAAAGAAAAALRI